MTSGRSDLDKTYLNLAGVIEDLSVCNQSVVNPYDLQEADAYFKWFRSQYFYEAILYGRHISSANIILVEKLRFIASTYRNALRLPSISLLRTLPAAFKEVGDSAKLLDSKHNAVIRRLSKLEGEIKDQRDRTASRQPAKQGFFSMLLGSKGSAPSLVESYDILLSSIRDLMKSLKSMHEYVQGTWKLTLLVKELEEKGQWERVAQARTIGTAAHKDMSYLDVLRSGVSIMQDYETLRRAYKSFMEGLYSIREAIPQDIEDAWFQDIKEEVLNPSAISGG
jgi:hypothetical protein